MKNRYYEDNSGKYLLISLLIVILATAAFSGSISIHSLAADAKHAFSSLYHVIAGA